MFGIFMTAVPVGALSLYLLKKLKTNSFDGSTIEMPRKPYHHGIVLGSLLFGFGWALTGACPGPIYAQLGSGVLVTIVTLISALAGTWTFGLLQKYLPD